MSDVLEQLEVVLEERRRGDPESSYVASLYAKGRETILKKVGEEAVEAILAGQSGNRDEVVYEVADLLFHMMVMLKDQGLGLADVERELGRRFGISGHVEKAGRGQ